MPSRIAPALPGAAVPMCSGRMPSSTLAAGGGGERARGIERRLARACEAEADLGAVDAGYGGRQEVHRRRADEGGDELVLRAVVEVERRADLRDAAAVEHDDAVGQRHRLDLVVGDVDHRASRAPGGAWRARAASAPGAWRRGWRAARRRGRPRGSRTSARPIATRWRWPPESCAGLRSISASSCSSAATLSDFSAISRFGGAGDVEAEADVLPHASCAGRARRTGTPSRCAASPAARG